MGNAEQQRCECGQAWFNEPMGVWLQEIARGNMQGQAEGFCAKCGCRLSVVDGEPRVGEAYADLERDAKRFRAVEAMIGMPIPSQRGSTEMWYFATYATMQQYATLGEYADALLGGEADDAD